LAVNVLKIPGQRGSLGVSGRSFETVGNSCCNRSNTKSIDSNNGNGILSVRSETNDFDVRDKGGEGVDSSGGGW